MVVMNVDKNEKIHRDDGEGFLSEWKKVMVYDVGKKHLGSSNLTPLLFPCSHKSTSKSTIRSNVSEESELFTVLAIIDMLKHSSKCQVLVSSIHCR